MKMVNNILLSTLVIILVSLFVNGQDDGDDFNRFSQLTAVDYFSPAIGYETDLYGSATIKDGVFYGLQPISFITFPTANMSNYLKDGRTSDSKYYQFSSVSVVTLGAAITSKRLYTYSTSTLYRVEPGNLGSLESLDYSNGDKYTGLSTFDGAVSFNENVYFLANKDDVNKESVLLVVDDSTTGIFTDVGYTEILLDAKIQTPTSIVVDKVNGLAFIGDKDGDIEIFDLNTNTNVFVYQNASVANQRSSGVVDSVNKVLYICGSTNSSSTTVDKFSYTATGLTMTSRIEIDGILCTAAAIDTVGGQVFFSVVSTSGSQLIGFDYEGENQGMLIEALSDSKSIALNVDTATMRFTIFYETTIYTGLYQSICPSDCSGAGKCELGVCKCNWNYQGEGCEVELCMHKNNCTSTENGVCANGECYCTSIYEGLECQTRRCNNSCSNNGVCDVANDYTCVCDPEYVGESCELPAPPPECYTFKNSESCLTRTYCGWCEVDGECREGDRYGPLEGFCRTWFFDSKVETGVIALAIIFIAFIGILYLIDIGTTIPVDLRRAKDYKEEYKSGQHPKASHEEASILWWRDQRSHKAWTFMDQFQFVSLVSHIGVIFPSRFISFTEYLDWSNLGIPLPPSINPPQVWSVSEGWTRVSTRTILAMAQYENSLGVGDLYLLPNILFWFGLLMGVFLVPLLCVLAVISFIEKLVHWKEVLTNRIIHISVRLLTFSYIGVLLAASFAMVTPLHDYRIIIPGAIIFVLYGIGLPVAIWFILNVPENRLHNPTFKQQFGCLYVHFKPKTDHRFIVFMFIKRFIMAVIVGILSFRPLPQYPLSGGDLAIPIVQVVVIDIALIGYAVLLFIRKPYFDHYQLWLEYLLTAINIVTVSLSLTHIKSPSSAGELIACLIQALALITCIAAYIISWLQMRSAFIKKVKKYLCCCFKGDKGKDVELSNK